VEPKKILLDSWTRQFSYDQWVSNHAQTSLLNEGSLEKHILARTLSSKTWTWTAKTKGTKWTSWNDHERSSTIDAEHV
jgi:hypothetical protein